MNPRGKKRRDRKKVCPRRDTLKSDWLPSIREALTAINRAVAARLEGDPAGFSALGADRLKHLALGIAAARISFSGIAAGLAALRLVGESFFGVEFLLAGSELKFVSAVFANECFVVVHEIPL